MSRSRKKAIIKDVGHRKEDYWRVHRRVNKQINSHFYSSSTHISPQYWMTDYDELYFETIQKYKDLGMTQEEAYYEAIYEHEDDFWVNRLVGNSCRHWWEEPEFKQPKELVNDYDYKDWVLDYEYGWGYSFYMSQDNYTGNNDWKEKFRRK